MNNEQRINHEKNKKLPYALQTDIWETIYIEGLLSSKWDGLGKLWIFFNCNNTCSYWNTIWHIDNANTRSKAIEESKEIIKYHDKGGL